MRFISKSALIVLATALAISVVGSASASAAECPGTGEGVALCSGGHALEGTFAFTGKQVPGTEKLLEFPGWGKPSCEKAKSKGQLVATKGKVEVRSLVIEWSPCHIVGNPPGCSVKPIIFDGSKGTGSGPGLKGVLANTSEITLSAMEGNKLTTMYVESAACELAGEWQITGKQTCKLPASTTEATIHVVECTTQGSELKRGTQSVFLAFKEEIVLSPSKVFSLQRS